MLLERGEERDGKETRAERASRSRSVHAVANDCVAGQALRCASSLGNSNVSSDLTFNGPATEASSERILGCERSFG